MPVLFYLEFITEYAVSHMLIWYNWKSNNIVACGGWHILFPYLQGKEVLQMTTYEAMSLVVGFGTLIVAIIALSYTFSQKK
jgi:hypothetical protein